MNRASRVGAAWSRLGSRLTFFSLEKFCPKVTHIYSKKYQGPTLWQPKDIFCSPKQMPSGIKFGFSQAKEKGCCELHLHLHLFLNAYRESSSVFHLFLTSLFDKNTSFPSFLHQRRVFCEANLETRLQFVQDRHEPSECLSKASFWRIKTHTDCKA